jgi:hypothetical protein
MFPMTYAKLDNGRIPRHQSADDYCNDTVLSRNPLSGLDKTVTATTDDDRSRRFQSIDRTRANLTGG